MATATLDRMVNDIKELDAELLFQGYKVFTDNTFITRDGGNSDKYFCKVKHNEAAVVIRLKYYQKFKFYNIEEVIVSTVDTNHFITNNHFDPCNFNQGLKAIVDNANVQLHEEFEGYQNISVEYMAAVLAEDVITKAYNLYHSI